MPFSFLPFSIHIVKGHSMQPTLNEGTRVVVYNWACLFSQPKAGDVVAFRGSDKKTYVKRIAAAASKDEFVVEGDNKEDTKKLPPVRRSAIIGRVIGKY